MKGADKEIGDILEEFAEEHGYDFEALVGSLEEPVIASGSTVREGLQDMILISTDDGFSVLATCSQTEEGIEVHSVSREATADVCFRIGCALRAGTGVRVTSKSRTWIEGQRRRFDEDTRKRLNAILDAFARGDAVPKAVIEKGIDATRRARRINGGTGRTKSIGKRSRKAR